MEGKYDALTKVNYPLSPGWEGAGTVVASGGGVMAWMVNGKRVAFSKADEGKAMRTEGVKLGGSYQEYVVTNAYQCVALPDDVSFEQGASFFVNPLTAIGMIDVSMTKHKAKAIIMTAAASQLCRMMLRIAG